MSVLARGVDGAVHRFTGVGGRAQNLSPAWDEVAGQIMRQERARFLSRGYGKWAPNARATIRRKVAHGQHGGPLIGTGRLLAALTVRGAPGQTLRSTRDSLLFGANRSVYYARFQGRRDPVGLRRPDITRARETVMRYIAGSHR